MKLRSLFLLNILFLSGIFVYAQTPEITVRPQDASHDDSSMKGYTLGPGDQIAGNVFGEQGWDFVVNIDEDGMIAIPFIEKPIVAQCKTERELKTEIETEIRKFLREPRLNFRVSEKHSRAPVTVYGEINKVAEITLTRPRTLLEVLAAAGGAKEAEASGLVEVR